MVENVYMQGEELRASILQLESYEVLVLLGTVADSLSRIRDFSSNIAEIAVNSAIQDK